MAAMSNCLPQVPWCSTHVKTTNITPRSGHSMVYYQNKIYLFGGATKDSDLNEVYELEMDPSADTIVGKLLPISSFPSLYEFAVVLDGRKLWIFGGSDKKEPQNEIYIFDMETHTCQNVKPLISNEENIPAPRTQHGNKTLVEIDGCKNLVMFGGADKDDVAVNDVHLYAFNIENNIWTKLESNGTPPPPRQGHVMVYVHGGLGPRHIYNDVHVIDLSSNNCGSWIKIDCSTKPIARVGHNVTVVDAETFYIYGGFNRTGRALSDLWKFNTKTLTWTEINYTGRVSPRGSFAMCAITNVENEVTKILVHGGFNYNYVFFSDFVMISPQPED